MMILIIIWIIIEAILMTTAQEVNFKNERIPQILETIAKVLVWVPLTTAFVGILFIPVLFA